MRATYYKIAAGDRLRAHRLKAGLTQKQVGEFLGLSASGWSRVEKGSTTATVVHLYQFAELVDCTVGEILGEIHVAVPPLRERPEWRASLARAIINNLVKTALEAFVLRDRPLSDKGRKAAYARAGLAREELFLLLTERDEP